MALRLHSKSGRRALRRIVLERLDGLPHETIRAVALSFEEAEGLIKAWALTAPRGPDEHHRVAVEVLWSDGTTLEVTHPLRRRDAKKSRPLTNWITKHLATVGGLWKPPGVDQESFDLYRSGFTAADQALAVQILDEYEL